jgi:zinc and cadmium transporter
MRRDASMHSGNPAAAHEVPQELGDFGVLILGGWKKRTALLFRCPA